MSKLIMVFMILQANLVFALDYGENTYNKGEKLEVPRRDHSIIISPEGYYPSHISIFQGEKVRFFVTNTDEESSCLLLPDKKLYMEVRKGEISEGEAVFEKPGTYPFYCPKGKIKGQIVVLEKIQDKIRRQVAQQNSERKSLIKIWRPRDN
jgi:plastocyanin